LRQALQAWLASLQLDRSLVRTGAQMLRRKLSRYGMRSQTLEIGDFSLHLWRADAGVPLVMLHGFGASGLWQWHDQVPALTAAGYAPVIPDLLWFGESRDKAAHFNIGRQSDAMLAMLDALAIDRFHLAGLSYGGMIAHDLATRVQARIASVTLVSSPGRAFMADDQRELLADYGLDNMAELLLPHDAKGVTRLFDVAYADPPYVPRIMRDQVIKYFYDEHRDARMQLLASIEGDVANLRARDWVPDEPTQLIWGANDRVFPLAVTDRLLAELGEYARLTIIPDAGHAPQLERPVEFNRAWLSFLGDHPIADQ